MSPRQSAPLTRGMVPATAFPGRSPSTAPRRPRGYFLAACASENEHFCKTTEVCDEGEGRIRAVLSGRSVIGLLIALRNTHSAASMDGTWALASAFYQRLAEDLTTTSRHGAQR
ncbi:hypothetical protein [Streptomyces platensis]|uniref:hypothetical protein n=1 Tax=Streptomyces platensis TaxID=58346 RepID=UPI003868E1B5|nr:hypothetical protein OG962_03855 [Streptomyces platensis]